MMKPISIINILKGLSISSIAFIWTLSAFPAPNVEDIKNTRVVEANFPQELAALNNESSGAKLTLENGLGYAFEKVDFKTKEKNQYLVVIYKAAKSLNNILCKLVVIKLGAKANSVMSESVLNDKDELGNCSNIQIKDLDGDGKPEVLVQSSNYRGRPLAPFVFLWNEDKLIDITPTTILGGDKISAFRKLSISDIKVGKSNLIIDRPFESNDENGKVITYILDNNKIQSTGTFDFYEILESKQNRKIPSIVLKPSVAQEGAYVLDIKNLSELSNAVSIEVTVNGVVVIKLQDLSSPTSNTRAIVNLSKTNEIKVKINDQGNSKIQLSLVKQ